MNIENISPSEQVNGRTLCLTPECQKLWAIRPGLCFLYDQIVMDATDFEEILSKQDDSTFNFILARNVERLRMEGILKPIRFSPLITSDIRLNVHKTASSCIESLPMERRVELATFGHGEYARYLEGQILFCDTSEPKYKRLIERLDKVKRRINDLRSQKKTNKEIDESMKRVVAKSLAGSYIAAQFGDASLYDTSEYRPFIKSIQLEDPNFRNTYQRFHDNAEEIAIDIVAAIVFDKQLPDVTVYDDHSLTKFLKTRENMEKLKNLIEEVINRYRDLLKTSPETAKEHMYNNFKKAKSALDYELKLIGNKLGVIWKVTEILASLKLPVLQPLLGPLYNRNMDTYKSEHVKNLREKDEMMADLLFVFDQVRFDSPISLPEVKRTYREPKGTAETIWGEHNNEIPWYERPK